MILLYKEHSYYNVLRPIALNFCMKLPFSILSRIDTGFIPRKRTVFKFKLFSEVSSHWFNMGTLNRSHRYGVFYFCPAMEDWRAPLATHRTVHCLHLTSYCWKQKICEQSIARSFVHISFFAPARRRGARCHDATLSLNMDVRAAVSE